ncbi:hypothetical protein CGZ94_00045 [Enemella evansiae]|uniref:Uncharacterized protein n=2 Tax=Enemella evansiae TaxID=2016499 RepID=A0A255GSF0_9ACTN|nr:hypothetical protein CGZ94_00045 [Enemella evansiae]
MKPSYEGKGPHRGGGLMGNQIRFGVIGGGIRGAMFAGVIAEHPRSELIAFCETAPAVAERLGEHFGVPVHGDLDRFFDEELDAVVIATPDFAHREPGLAALQHGVDVLFEKPLATTREDALTLQAAAAESSSRVMLGFENRWNPTFRRARERLTDAGSTLIAQRVLLSDTEFVPRSMFGWADRSTPGWFLFPHTLDLAMWLSGSRPTEVFARGVKKVLAPDGIDTYDRISASLSMSDGSLLDLASGWVSPTSRPSVFQFRYGIEAAGLEMDLEIDRGGSTSYDSDTISYLHGPDRDHRGRLTGPAIEMMRDFIDLCDGADLDVPGLDTGLQVTLALATLHDALESNSNLRIHYTEGQPS